MKKIVKKILVSAMTFVFIFSPLTYFENTNISRAEDEERETYYFKDLGIESIDQDFYIPESIKLIINDMDELNFFGESTTIYVMGELVIEGEEGNPLVLKRGDPDSSFSISTNVGSRLTMNNVEIIGGGYEGEPHPPMGFLPKAVAADDLYYVGAVSANGGYIYIENTNFKDNFLAFESNGERVEETSINVYNSNFIDNDFDVIDYNNSYPLMNEDGDAVINEEGDAIIIDNRSNFKNNYWDSIENTDLCNNTPTIENCFLESRGYFEFNPWLESENILRRTGASNVLFLPGIKASYLYEKNTMGSDRRLWPPEIIGNDIERLILESNGDSAENVFAKENNVLRQTLVGDIYDSFLDDLEKMKSEEFIINDYKAFAYDWRQSVEDIAENGTPYGYDELKFVMGEITQLAQTSKSGKVTIVAHSNGGLLAKATMILMNKLAMENKVDKIIMVGTPQMGTPLTTLSMLYGYEEAIPLLVSQKDARKLVENMPGAYGLLPSEEYLSRQKEVGEALINFSSENSERGKMFRDAYGEEIDTLDEFRDFLLAKEDNREKPNKSEINLENILNEGLLDEAITMHEELDNWTPPADVKVIQLAGWGLSTVSGIEYIEKKKEECGSFYDPVTSLPNCYDTEEYELVPKPKRVRDGDEIVTTPSGLMMTERDNVKRYWFDLDSYDTPLTIGRKHRDILEASDIRDFIKNELLNNDAVLSGYISSTEPENYGGDKPEIRISLYSPLDMYIQDTEGNYTGYREIETGDGVQKVLEENIPNSYYFQLGERKYIGFEEGENVEVKLEGYGEGAYTLKIEKVNYLANGEENIIDHITFKNLPTLENTKVNITVPESGFENISSLKADYDGNGEDDYILEPVIGGEVTLPDMMLPVINIISPENKEYVKRGELGIEMEINDNKSSKEDITVEKFLDGNVLVQDKIDLSLLKTREHKLSIKATDEAENVAEKEVLFELTVDISTLKENINHYYDLRLIKSQQEKKMLINNVNVIEKQIEMYEKINDKKHFKLKKNVRNLLSRIIESNIEKHIDILVRKIERDKKNYDIMIKEIIVDDLEFIKINIKK